MLAHELDLVRWRSMARPFMRKARNQSTRIRARRARKHSTQHSATATFHQFGLWPCEYEFSPVCTDPNSNGNVPNKSTNESHRASEQQSNKHRPRHPSINNIFLSRTSASKRARRPLCRVASITMATHQITE